MHRLTLLAATAACALTLLQSGCAHQPVTVPGQQPASDLSTALTGTGMAVAADGLVQAPVGRGLLQLDANAMSATWEPLPLRTGQDNESVYALSVNEFLKPVDLQIRAFRRSAAGFEIDYEFTHPFRSSELSGRADLGFSGLFLLGVTPTSTTSYTWFKDDPSELIADPRWVLNADGYYKPGGLVDSSAVPANAFPYLLLVDERGTGNRRDAQTGAPVTNGGSPTGNFLAPHGWQSGPTSSWSGYGVIHQGQKVRNTIVIDSPLLSGVGSLPVITVLLAKYADPKSATPGFEHRLPADPPDVTGHFGYRMPHGALDVSEASLAGQSDGWLPNVETTASFAFHVVDWDARATETTMTSLNDDPNATHVRQGEAGTPELALCIPGILGDRSTITVITEPPIDDDSAFGGDPEEDSGVPGDALCFAFDLTKPAGTGQSDGDYLAWLQVTDVEVATQNEYLVALNPDLTPITGELPLPVTYHPFVVHLGAPCDPPQGGIGWATEFGNPDASDTGLYGVAVDSSGNTYTFGNFLGQIDLGGGVIPSAGNDDLFLVKHSATGAYVWGKVIGGARSEAGRGIAVDPNGDVWIGGSHGGATDFGGGLLTPPGQYNMFLARYSSNGTHEFSQTYGVFGFNWLAAITTSATHVYVTGYFNDRIDFGTGILTSAGNEDIAVGSITLDGIGEWGRRFGGTTADRGYSLALDTADGLYVGGSFTGTVDFGPGSPTAAGMQDAYLLKVHASSGAPIWVNAWGGPDNDQTWRVRADTAMNYVNVAGDYRASVNLGGTDLPGQGTDKCTFLGQFDATGTHRWSKGFFDVTANLDTLDLFVNPDGSLIIAGSFFDQVSFGGPARFGNGSAAGYLAKFARNGAWIADGQIGGAGGDEIRALNRQASGHVIYAGYADGNVDMNPDCNIAPYAFDADGAFFVARTASDLGW